MPVLDYCDPRLGVKIAPADTRDTTTRVAIRAVMDELGPHGDRVVSAPALGLPVRVIGVRINDSVSCLLNPTIVSAGAISYQRGETSPHTGRMRYNAHRALQIEVEGVSLAGITERIKIPEGAVISAQQAFDLMDKPDAFSWVTAFHRLWWSMRDTAHDARFTAVSEALFTADAARGIRDAGGQHVTLLADDGHEIGALDTANPLVPLDARNRALLALVLSLSGIRSIMLCDAAKTSFAVALLLVSPVARLAFARGAMPTRVVATLGLADAIQPAPYGLDNFPDDAPQREAIVIDLAQGSALPTPRLAAIAKSLAGTSGALIVVAPATSSQLEDALQRHFAALFLFEPRDDAAAIYVARKSDITGDAMRARLLTMANRLDASDALLSACRGSWRLRKDGQREAL